MVTMATTAAARSQSPSSNVAVGSVAEIFSDCLRRSTVRGIPRIFSSRSPILKALWTVSVLVLFALFLMNLTGTVSIYMRGDTMFSNMKWEPLPPFPSFTICNFKPISAVLLPYTNLTPEAYRHRIIELVQNSKMDKEDGLNILFKLLEPRVYHDHLNMSEVLKLTEADSLIMQESCHVHYVNNSISQVKRCSDDPSFASVEFRYIPGYSHCQTVRIKQGNQVKKVVLHVLLRSSADNVNCWYCMLENPATLRKGIILYLHHDHDYPVRIEDGLFVLPGTQNIIHVKQKKVLHVKDCESRPAEEHVDFYLAGQYHRSNYYPDLCKFSQITDLYRKFCGCTTQTLPQRVPRGENLSRYPLCFRQDLNASQLDYARLHCILDVDSKGDDGRHVNPEVQRFMQELAKRSDDNGEDNSDCRGSCTFVRHTVAHSSSVGVTKSSALEIFGEYIVNSELYRRDPAPFEAYANALKMKQQNRMAEAEAWLNSTDYLEKNFLTLVLSFSKHHALKQKEHWVMESSSLIGQIGGALALFSGITLICVAELVELLFNLLDFLQRRLQRRASSGGRRRREVDRVEGENGESMVTFKKQGED